MSINIVLCGVGGQGTVLASKIMAKAAMNKGLKVNGLPGKLTLDSDPAEFEAGILLEGDHYDINGDFEVLLQQVRNKYEREVAAILFEDRDEA